MESNKPKHYIIKEFNTFADQMRRDTMGSATKPINDPGSSAYGYGRFVDDQLYANRYMASILKTVMKDTPMASIEGEEELLSGLNNLQIRRIYEKNEDLNVYFSIALDDEEYFGSIEKYLTESNFSFELFTKEPYIAQNIKLKIKITGIIKKSIANFFKIKHGKFTYMGDNDLKITNEETGQHAFLKKGDKIAVMLTDRGYVQFRMIDSVKYTPYKLVGIPVYKFHYYFNETNKDL